MNQPDNRMRNSGQAMRIIGWGILVGPLAVLAYPPGFLWGEAPGLPGLGPAHPESHLQGLHPYLFMLFSVYAGWAILLLRGAHDPKSNAALFDWGILANVLHALLMIPLAFLYPNEHAHLRTDVPLLLAICFVCWAYHPNRVV
jgi:hypothetical protein